MSSSNGKDLGLGNKQIIVIIGLIGSCIAIFTFLTGRQSIWDWLSSSSPVQQSTSAPVVSVPNNIPTSTFPSVLANWTSLGLVGESVSDISSSGAGGEIYVSTFGNYHGIFKSGDEGKTWTAINNGLGNLDIILIRAVAKLANTKDIIYAISKDGSTTTIWRTVDGGEHWQICKQGALDGLDVIESDVIFIGENAWGNDGPSRILTSSNGCKSWKSLGGLHQMDHWFSSLLVVSNTNPDTMYALDYGDQINRSTNGGITWLKAAGVGQQYPIRSFAVSIWDPNIIISITNKNGVYLTSDGGGSWLPINNSLPNQGSNLVCTDVKASPWEEKEVFVVCNGQIFQSKDLGEQWVVVQSPEEVSKIYLLANPRVMLAATQEHGVFSYNLPSTTSLVAVPITSPTRTPPTSIEEIARIVFESDRDGKYQIYLMNTDGTDQTRLTNVLGDFAGFPDWSPDQTRIAFHSFENNDGTSQEIFIINADGSGLTQITNNSTLDGAPDWSPDGLRIAFTCNGIQKDGREVCVINVDGSGQMRLTNNSSADGEAKWSPDGSQITFYSERDGNTEVYVMQADGTRQLRLTNNSAVDWPTAWSPDGTRILFTTNRDGNNEIYMMNADGTNPINLTNNSADDTSGVYSADGQLIIFTSNRDGKSQIYIMNADGSGQTQLISTPSNDSGADW